MPHSDTVRSIRNRLFLLLLRAFIIVVAFLDPVHAADHRRWSWPILRNPTRSSGCRP